MDAKDLTNHLQRCIDRLEGVTADNEADGTEFLNTAIHRSMPFVQAWIKSGYFRTPDGENAAYDPLELPNQGYGERWKRSSVLFAWAFFLSELRALYPNRFALMPGLIREGEVRQTKQFEDAQGRGFAHRVPRPGKLAPWATRRNDYIEVFQWMIEQVNERPPLHAESWIEFELNQLAIMLGIGFSETSIKNITRDEPAHPYLRRKEKQKPEGKRKVWVYSVRIDHPAVEQKYSQFIKPN